LLHHDKFNHFGNHFFEFHRLVKISVYADLIHDSLLRFTVIPSGRFYTIVEQKNLASMNTPIYGPGNAAPAEERTITRMHRLQNIAAQEAGDLLNKFKSATGDVTVHAPTTMLILTDPGAHLRRMLRIVEEIDVGGPSEQVWIEKINYGAASEAATRLNDLFDIKGAGATPAGAAGKPGGAASGGDSRISKVISDDRTNSVIIVATERAYLRALEFIKVIDVPQTGEGEVHVRPLQYADAAKLAGVLSRVSDSSDQVASRGGTAQAGQKGGGVFEGGIKVVADDATNSLIITSSLRDYAHMRQVIDRLDKPRRQVFIEAALMDLNVSRTDKFGIKFHGGIPDVPVDGSLIAGGLDPLKSALALGPGAAESLQGFALGLRGPTIPGSEAIFGTAIPAVGVVLDMLASSGDSDLLATPHILATDNIEAKIHVGENKPQQTNAGLSGAIPGLPGGAASLGGLSALGGMAGGFGTGGMLQTGIKVSIKPSINESDEVRLQIKEEYSEPLAPEGTLGVRGSSQRTAETTLTVRDQQTVVIAGLVRSKNGRGQTKVPVLGDIPLLGALFRSETKQIEKSNLLLVLTPHIIRSQDDLRRVFERKMQDRQEFLDRYFVFSDSDYNAPKDYARTFGVLEDVRKSYIAVEERRELDALLGAKAIKTHTPGRPLELPAPIRSQGGVTGSPEVTPAVPGGGLPTPPRVDGRPPVRNILKVEP
jgi:general secretion pathway protein D